MSARAGQPVVVGGADDGGWAILASVAVVNDIPTVIDRRRVATIEAGVPTQPYHHDTLSMANAEAERLVRAVKRSVAAAAIAGLRAHSTRPLRLQS